MSYSKTSRSRLRGLVVPVLAAILVGLVGCGGGGEEREIISRFFSASRMGDRTTAANIAMVAFDPDEDGTVGSFDVTNVAEEQRRPLQIQDLAEALAQARAETQDHDERMRAYQDENVEAIGRVIEAERAGESVASRDAEVQAAWSTFRDETQTLARAVSEAESALGEESQVATVSVFDASNPIDVRQYGGELLSKEVTINANVSRGDSTEERTMVIMLQKVELGSGDTTIEGRWVIIDIS